MLINLGSVGANQKEGFLKEAHCKFGAEIKIIKVDADDQMDLSYLPI